MLKITIFTVRWQSYGMLPHCLNSRSMGKQKEKTMVGVKVCPALKEYIMAVNSGSDIIVPLKNSRLWGLVKMHLEPVPDGYIPMPADGMPDYIRIAIYDTARPSWSVRSKSVVTVHSSCRCHLSEHGQRAVARHLMLGFKQVFRAYMSGALGNNPELDINDAIDEFCEDYGIENEAVSVEMLRKDWYRYRRRCSRGGAVPVENSDL